jgi:hypothetical protein
MRLQLQSIHFGGGPVMSGGGQLILRCTAQIGNIYQESTEKELGVPQKDPIPARGKQTFENLILIQIKFLIKFLYSYLVNCHRLNSSFTFHNNSHNLRHINTPIFEIIK